MAKKKNRALLVVALLVLVGLPAYGVYLFGENIGWKLFGVYILAGITLIGLFRLLYRRIRRGNLMEKYQDAKMVSNIMSQGFWQGQTREQLLDSLGDPQEIDERVMKTKTREVWKYDHQGSNRYSLRITLENDIVTGWDQKN